MFKVSFQQSFRPSVLRLSLRRAGSWGRSELCDDRLIRPIERSDRSNDLIGSTTPDRSVRSIKRSWRSNDRIDLIYPTDRPIRTFERSDRSDDPIAPIDRPVRSIRHDLADQQTYPIDRTIRSIRFIRLVDLSAADRHTNAHTHKRRYTHARGSPDPRLHPNEESLGR